VKSWKEIFPLSSAPSWLMISATDPSIFSWRQTINKSFLQKWKNKRKCVRKDIWAGEKTQNNSLNIFANSRPIFNFLTAPRKVVVYWKQTLFHLGYSRQKLHYYLEGWGNF
jgi:hypothetical protein